MMPTEYRPKRSAVDEDLLALTVSPATLAEVEIQRYEPPDLRVADLSPEEIEATHSMFHGEALHPWEQGVRFFPKDHPLYGLETQALREQEAICGLVDHAYNVVCVAPKGHSGDHTWEVRGDKTKALESGN
jgi:hypothetical protein